MSKLHAQMALLGTIDELVRHTDNDETIKVVESFLPGTTGVGQQGWYGELQRFLSKDELKRDAYGNELERDGDVTFPSYTQALDELRSEPLPGEKPASPGTQSRALFAATVLSKAIEAEGTHLPPVPGLDPLREVDPLDALMPMIARNMSGPLPPMPGLEQPNSSGNAVEDMTSAFRSVKSRQDYVNMTSSLARIEVVDPELKDIMMRPVVCTGALRKIDGQFCTLLTTSWDSPFTLSQIKEIIDPHNWPDLCDFFVSMDDQDPIKPDRTRGWTRVLESVSGDKTQWQMQTALRYWKGVTTPGDGVYINYDLDDPRVKDCKLVEVDAGYLWATPLDADDPDSTVRLRTCKQVRIRGVSSTATAALSCGFGWGDAMSQMFEQGVKHPPADSTKFAPSQERPIEVGKTDPSAMPTPADGESDHEIEEAAEEVELIKGWRGAIIEAMRKQLTEGIDKASDLGTDFAVRWSDGEGLSLEDVKEFGARYGSDMTAYATGIFKEAAAALHPPPEAANATGGND